MRSYAPVGHRHTAEVQQALGFDGVHLSVTAIEMVRGAMATSHVWLNDDLAEKDLWKIYRGASFQSAYGAIVARAAHRRRHRV